MSKQVHPKVRSQQVHPELESGQSPSGLTLSQLTLTQVPTLTRPVYQKPVYQCELPQNQKTNPPRCPNPDVQPSNFPPTGLQMSTTAGLAYPNQVIIQFYSCPAAITRHNYANPQKSTCFYPIFVIL